MSSKLHTSIIYRRSLSMDSLPKKKVAPSVLESKDFRILIQVATMSSQRISLRARDLSTVNASFSQSSFFQSPIKLNQKLTGSVSSHHNQLTMQLQKGATCNAAKFKIKKLKATSNDCQTSPASKTHETNDRHSMFTQP